MLKQRVITAIILVAVVVAAIVLLDVEQFAIASAAFVGIAAWEWAGLSFLEQIWQKGLYVLVTLVCLMISWVFSVDTILLVAVAFWLSNLFWVLTYPKYQTLWQRTRALGLISGVLVLIPFWMALIILKSETQGLYWLAYIITLIAGADIFAYFTGRKWGKTALIPRVSPGKTLIGLYASIVWAIFFSTLSSWWIVANVTEFILLLLTSLIIVLSSILGDLFESMIKRLRGVKDSGVILPGHGGLLDRIDSLTAALPLFVVAIELGEFFV